MRELVVNADDFGLSLGVNQGIARAHLEGIVTSASLMVRQPAAEAAAGLAHELPKLGVGLHVDLAEWGYRPSGWTRLYTFVDDHDELAVAHEVEHQLALFENLLGRPPDHLDSHQHTHRSEPLRSILDRIATELDVPLRHHSLFRYVGGFYGQSREGTPLLNAISPRGLLAAIAERPDGAIELCCHPAAQLDFQSSYGQERLQELNTLCDLAVREAHSASGFRLDSFTGHRAHLQIVGRAATTVGEVSSLVEKS